MEPKITGRKTRFIRIALFALLGLVTVAAMIWTEENWRGRRAWEKYKREWEAKGERFDLASFAPKPVPPEQNFAATPFLAPLLDYQIVNGEVRWNSPEGIARARRVTIPPNSLGSWQKAEFADLKAVQKSLQNATNFPVPAQSRDPAHDILFALQKFEPVLAELRAASQRPESRYSIHPVEDIPALIVQVGVLRGLTQTTVLRALAHLEAGESAEALADVKLAISLGQSLRSEPLLIPQVVRFALLNLSLQPVWEGLARHRWTDAQLEELQKLISSINLLEDYGFTMRSERAFSNELLSRNISGDFSSAGQQLLKTPSFLVPRGILYQNQVMINRLMQEFAFPAVDAGAHRVHPEKCDSNAINAVIGSASPYNVLARMTFPAQKIVGLFAMHQTALDQAAIACALERYQLVHKKYPQSLDALAPQFINALPLDVITGQPLAYRATANGQITLYSVGWNGKDEGGTVALKKNGGLDSNEGDWVWRYPSQ